MTQSRVAIVTGASQGIGDATAQALAAEGDMPYRTLGSTGEKVSLLG